MGAWKAKLASPVAKLRLRRGSVAGCSGNVGQVVAATRIRHRGSAGAEPRTIIARNTASMGRFGRLACQSALRHGSAGAVCIGVTGLRSRLGVATTLAVGLVGTGAAAQDSAGTPVPYVGAQSVELDLAQSFKARSAWRLVVTEGPVTKDYGGNDAPGALTLCLHKTVAGPCVSAPVTPALGPAPSGGPRWEPHYLLTAEVVHLRGAKTAPVLLLVTGSLHSGDGDQIVETQLVAYDASQDAFRRVYSGNTGRNNNQEIRFVKDGPLQGSVIAAKPQARQPYGYWIEVNRPTPTGSYHRVLRYQSATRYDDGNPLPVIGSEMPNIERRLGLWKPGQPIPPPGPGGSNKPCPRPRLRRTELWCG